MGYAVLLQKGRSKNFQSRDAVGRPDPAIYELASDKKTCSTERTVI